VTVMGIDLSASEKRFSGVCVLRGLKARTFLLKNDDEIIALAKQVQPKLVAIDAPLSLPTEGGFRQCDRELLKRGVPLFPVTFGPMKQLAERGIRLKRRFESEGFCVVEVFPGGAQDLLRLPRKRWDLTKLKEGLRELGLRGLNENATVDEIDAATAAFVGWMWLKGFAEMVGDGQGGGIVMPLPYPLKFMEGVRLYRAGRYWQAHEAWEEVWRTASEPDKSFLKGLIQIAAALIQSDRGKWKGALNLLNRVQRYLRNCPPKLWGVDLAKLREQVDAFRQEVTELLSGRKSRFNWKVKPRLLPEGMRMPEREKLRRSKSDLPKRAR